MCTEGEVKVAALHLCGVRGHRAQKPQLHTRATALLGGEIPTGHEASSPRP